MSENSGIEWCEHTFNAWTGCHPKRDDDGYHSPECQRCYAEVFARRGLRPMGDWKKNGERVVASETYWEKPIAWDSRAGRLGQRHRVFCASMADVFENHDGLDGHRARLWDLIAKTPNLDWLLLTKRPEFVGSMVPWGDDWPTNVWLGTTAGVQETADRRIPHLLKHPAAVRFVSVEPMLSQVDLGAYIQELDWVIMGGESGKKARPTNPDWLRALRDQVLAAGKALFFKQWGVHAPGADGLIQLRRSKTEIEAVLDGQMWRQFPQRRGAGAVPPSSLHVRVPELSASSRASAAV